MPSDEEDLLHRVIEAVSRLGLAPGHQEELRGVFVIVGRMPSKTSALVVHLEEHNNGVEVARALIQHVELAIGETSARLDEMEKTLQWLLGPLAAGGIGVFSLGALSAIGIIGSSGATLVALGGMAMFGGSTIGIIRMLRERSLLMSDRTAMETLRRRLETCEKELIARRGP